MSDVELCPQCGGEPDEVLDVVSFGERMPVRRISVFRCCVPPPSPTALRRGEEDEWLRRQREMASAGNGAVMEN